MTVHLSKHALLLSLLVAITMVVPAFAFVLPGTNAGELDVRSAAQKSFARVAVSGRANESATGVANALDGGAFVIGYGNYRLRGKYREDTTVLAKVTKAGKLDKRFGHSGALRFDAWPRHDETPTSVVVQEDGRVVVVGVVNRTRADSDADPFNGYFVARFTSKGRLDRSFGSHGHVIGRFSKRFASNSSAVTVNLVGSSMLVSGESEGDFVVHKLNRRGKLVRSFGANGKKRINADIEYTGAIAERSGRLFLFGDGKDTNGFQTCVVKKLAASGAIDTGFGRDGTTTLSLAADDRSVDCEAMLMDGSKVVVAGRRWVPNPNGDPGGVGDGAEVMSFSGTTGALTDAERTARHLALGGDMWILGARDSSGRVDLITQTGSSSCDCVDVVRLDRDLAPDESKGPIGVVRTSVPGRRFEPAATAAAKSGRLFVVGDAVFSSSRRDLLIVRLPFE